MSPVQQPFDDGTSSLASGTTYACERPPDPQREALIDARYTFSAIGMLRGQFVCWVRDRSGLAIRSVVRATQENALAMGRTMAGIDLDGKVAAEFPCGPMVVVTP